MNRRRPVHCPACAASRGVAIPAACPHRDPLAALRAVEPDARHGWHLIGAGTARYGWAVYTAAGAGRYLGRTALDALAAATPAADTPEGIAARDAFARAARRAADVARAAYARRPGLIRPPGQITP